MMISRFFNLKNAFLLIAFCTTMLLVACGNKCATADCKNGAECEKGICYCRPYYEGRQCETMWATKFVKGFTTIPQTGCDRPSFTGVDITMFNESTLEIRNFGGYFGAGCPEYKWLAKLTSSTSFKFDTTFCGNFKITGEGRYNETTKVLSVDYNCIRDTVTHNCTAIFRY